MSEDQIAAIHRRLDGQDAILKLVPAIHGALVGNEALGHKGLVSRVATVEGQVSEHNKKFVLAAGAVAGVTILFNWAKSKIGGG